MLTADVTCWSVGIAFLDASTVLPVLVQRLGGGPVVLGLLAALKHAAFFLPQLLVAHRLQTRARFLPFLLRSAFAGRASVWFAALALFVFAPTAPHLALMALAAGYVGLWIGDGLGMVPWTAIVGRAIPMTRRGQFFAATQIAGGMGRIGVGAIVGPLLAGAAWGIGFPGDLALCVLACGVFQIISWGFLALVREPAAPAADTVAGERGAESVPLGAFLRALPARLRARPAVLRLSVAQVLASAVVGVAPFYLAFAQNNGGMAGVRPGVLAGRFLIAQTVGALLCAPLWGWLSDRHGPRRALMVLFAVALSSPLAAVAGGLLSGGAAAAFFVAFFCLGAVLEGGWPIFTNYVLETVPGPEQTVFLGAQSTLNAPALVLPLLAGLLVRAAGTPVTLAVAVALLLAGALVARGLPDTRSRGSTA